MLARSLLPGAKAQITAVTREMPLSAWGVMGLFGTETRTCPN